MARKLVDDVRMEVMSELSKDQHLTEIMLAERMGVSRTPIREALQQLEAEGLIESRPRSGIMLKETSIREIIEIMDIRAVLEGLACRLAAMNADDTFLSQLRDKQAEFIRLFSIDRNQSVERDIEFHEIILMHSSNTRLCKMVKQLQLITISFRLKHQIGRQDKLERLKYPHEKVIEAFESMDPAGAEEAMRLHIEEGKVSVIQHFLGPNVHMRGFPV